MPTILTKNSINKIGNQNDAFYKRLTHTFFNTHTTVCSESVVAITAQTVHTTQHAPKPFQTSFYISFFNQVHSRYAGSVPERVVVVLAVYWINRNNLYSFATQMALLQSVYPINYSMTNSIIISSQNSTQRPRSCKALFLKNPAGSTKFK